MASGGNRWLQFSNNGGRGRSRDKIISIYFSSFLKFSLLYHLSTLVDVFNYSFWKLYIKTINDLDPGINLPEHQDEKKTTKYYIYIYIYIYYIETSVLLENILLVKFIKTTSGTRVVYFP